MTFLRLHCPGYSCLPIAVLQLEERIRLVAVVLADHDLALTLDLFLAETAALRSAVGDAPASRLRGCRPEASGSS